MRKKQLVHHTKISLEKIKVHIIEVATHSQKSLANVYLKDLGIVVWVAHMKPLWIHLGGTHLAAAIR
jgi:hypothetical protein